MENTPGFDMIPASTGSLIAFLAIILMNLILLGAALYNAYRAFQPERAAKKTRVIMFWVVVWLLAFAGVVATGFAKQNPMPGIPMLFLLVAITSITFAFSPIGTKLAAITPLHYLVLFQAFRIPLELVLNEWAQQGVIPKVMTWSGQNYDIFAGAISLVLFPFVMRWPILARMTNIIGFASLLNVIRVALFSSPIPFGWPYEPKLQLLTHIPYFLIGPAGVGLALIGHILVARALLGVKRTEPAPVEPAGSTMGRAR